MKQFPPIVLALGALAIILIVFSLGRSSATVAPQPSTVAPAPSPGRIPATIAPLVVAPPIVIPNGPSFQDADSKMSDNVSDWTEAQKDAYWNSINGTHVNWSGEVTDVDSKGSGQLTVKCNPNTWSSDVHVTLDGTQNSTLASLGKGVHINFSGIINGHGITGWYLQQGHIG